MRWRWGDRSSFVTEAPFALASAPLHRFRLGLLAPGRWVLAVVLHHMVCDGVSMGIVWRELAELYAAARQAREPHLPAAVPYTEYARWTPSNRAELERFWQRELSDVDVLPRLPADRPRTGRLSGCGTLHESVLPAELTGRIDAVATDLGTTPYAVLATALARLLAKVIGSSEVVLATSSANRLRPEHEHVVGLIGDAVLVRVRLAADDFADQVRAFTATLYTALDHQDLPLDDVITAVAPDRLDGQFPTVLFTVVTTPPPRLDLVGVESRIHAIPIPGKARTELYVRVEPLPDGTRIYWEYSTDLFTAATIATWDAELRGVLADLPHDVPARLSPVSWPAADSLPFSGRW